jgi:hypothetical protein
MKTINVSLRRLVVAAGLLMMTATVSPSPVAAQGCFPEEWAWCQAGCFVGCDSICQALGGHCVNSGFLCAGGQCYGSGWRCG